MTLYGVLEFGSGKIFSLDAMHICVEMKGRIPVIGAGLWKLGQALTGMFASIKTGKAVPAP